MSTKTNRGRPDRVLVVDDDEAVRAIVSAFLRESDIEVTCASDGAEALQRLHAGEAPDLVLLDLCMPNVDGWRVLAALRADEELKTLPVIVLTSLGTVEDLPSEVPVLHKPIDPDALTLIVATFLATPRADAAVRSPRASQPSAPQVRRSRSPRVGL
jgi:CheY-like chemotaxis protein